MPAKGVHFHRPQTSAELTEQARDFPYDPRSPLPSLLRYADAIKRQADGYAQHGEEQYAYLLYQRCRILVLELLPARPDAAASAAGASKASQRDRQGLARARAAVKEDVAPALERLGPSIDRRARHFSDAGKGVEVQTATEKGLPPPGKRKGRKPKPMRQVADAFGIMRAR